MIFDDCQYHQNQSGLPGRISLKNIDSKPGSENGEKIVSDFVMCMCMFSHARQKSQKNLRGMKNYVQV